MEVHELIEISGVNLTAVGSAQRLVLTDSALSHQFADLRKGEKSALFGALAVAVCGGVQVVCHGEGIW